jgi:hypothetical protein
VTFDQLVTVDAAVLYADELAKVEVILKNPRFHSVKIIRRPAGRGNIAQSIVRFDILERTLTESLSTRNAFLEELREKRIRGFFSYCDNCYLSDLALEIGQKSEARPCSYPETCIGKQKFPCPNCDRVCSFEELEEVAGVCCTACANSIE